MARIIWDARAASGRISSVPRAFANAGLPDRSIGTRGAKPCLSCRSPPGGGWFASAVRTTRGEMRVPANVQADAAPTGQSGRNGTRLIITASTLSRGGGRFSPGSPHGGGILASGAFPRPPRRKSALLAASAWTLPVLALWHFPLIGCPTRRALPATLVSWSPDFPRHREMTRLPGPLATGHLACPRSRSNRSSKSSAPICPSTCPSIRCGRQRRWNARTAAGGSVMS